MGSSYAQFFGNLVEKRVVSGSDGIYVFLLDEEYMLHNNGQMPSLYENERTFEIVRTELPNGEPVLIDTLSPIQNTEELNQIWKTDITKGLLADTSAFDFDNAQELVNYFQNPNNQFHSLYLSPLAFLRSIGFAYLDKTVKANTSYSYQIRWTDSKKVVLTDQAKASEGNKYLNEIKLHFNQTSIKSLDSLVSGNWINTGISNRYAHSYKVFGKRATDKAFVVLDTSLVSYAADTIRAGAFQKAEPGEVWQLYVQPFDILENAGTPSDTATVVAMSKGRLPFIKNLVFKDTTNAIHLSWEKLPKHSYLSGILLAREEENRILEIIDTLSLDATEYFDYDVENGLAYNYDLQPISAPINNLSYRDFISVRASGTHDTKERILPPNGLELSLEQGKGVRVSWNAIDDPEFNSYHVFVSLDPNNSKTFTNLGSVATDTTFLDTLQHGDFNHLTRYYAVKSLGYNLKFSALSNIKSIDPEVEFSVEKPIGLQLKSNPIGIQLNWEQDITSASKVQGYKIYRSIGKAPFECISDSLISLKNFLDDSPTAKNDYTYYVTAISQSGLESPPGLTQSISWKPKRLLIASQTFTKVLYRNIPPAIEISWILPENTEIEKVAIYRIDVSAEQDSIYTKIATVPADNYKYWDKSTQIGETYIYVLSGISKTGEESPRGFQEIIRRDMISEED